MQIPARIVWIELLRIIAATGILFYHASLYYTHYAYAPTPNGITTNLLQLVSAVNDHFGTDRDQWSRLVGYVSLFGFQFLDVFIVLIGATAALSWRDTDDVLIYLKRRSLRILWPYWLAVFVSFFLSAGHHYLFQGYIAKPWYWFAALAFPLTYDFHGSLLQQISGPWWFVPFMLAVTAVCPFMLKKMTLWGHGNFLLFFGTASVMYRLLSLYVLGAHTNYSIIGTPAGEGPYLLLPAKLFLLAIGMSFGQYIKTFDVTPHRLKLLFVGVSVYLLGFFAQFSWLGWVIAEPLYASAMVLVFYTIFARLGHHPLLLKLGALSYPFFLMHDLFINRFSDYFGWHSVRAFWLIVGWSIPATLFAALLIEKLLRYCPQWVESIWNFIDRRLDTGTKTCAKRSSAV